jgi:hypothetical protein
MPSGLAENFVGYTDENLDAIIEAGGGLTTGKTREGLRDCLQSQILVVRSVVDSREWDLAPDRETPQKQVNELLAEARTKEVPGELTEIGAGGELLPLVENNVAMMEEQALPPAALRNTVANPDYVAIDASRHRLELASRTGALEMGLDLADTVEASNSVERMISHQMAATHRATMHMRCV